MKKMSGTNARPKRDSGLRPEYRFDYSKIQAESIRRTHPAGMHRGVVGSRCRTRFQESGICKCSSQSIDGDNADRRPTRGPADCGPALGVVRYLSEAG